MTGLVIKKLANLFWVEEDGTSKVCQCLSRGNLKDKKVLVGDKVSVLSAGENENIIENIFPRKNELIRPPISNLDVVFIVIAQKPKTDFLMIDKMLLFCFSKNIIPIIVVNKNDEMSQTFENYVKLCYKDVCKIIFCSAKNEHNLLQIMEESKNKICCFAGQSAVGKSSLVNALFAKQICLIGGFSKKVDRGTHTTRHVQLFKVEDNSYIADTPGFTFLDEGYLDIKYDKLMLLYPDFVKYAASCKFSSCTHTHEKIEECAVKQAAQKSLISLERWNRYVTIFETLKRRWQNEFK